MRRIRSVMATLALVLALLPFSGGLMQRCDLEDEGAVCLDGTRYAYGFRQGHGRGRNMWIIHLQGGAWCATEEECAARRGSSLGGHPLRQLPCLGNSQSLLVALEMGISVRRNQAR
jgi:hypothetical protein